MTTTVQVQITSIEQNKNFHNLKVAKPVPVQREMIVTVQVTKLSD